MQPVLAQMVMENEKMKRAYLFTPLIALGVSSCGLTEPNVYPLAADDVLARIGAIRIESEPRGPFGTQEISHGRPAIDRISWIGRSSHSGVRCDVTVAPVDETSSRVDIACNSRGAGGGVSSPMEVSQTRKALIELIDSTLEGRPYDRQLARGATAAGWPKHTLKSGA